MMNSKTMKKIYLICLFLAAVMIGFGFYLCSGKSLDRLSIAYVRDAAVDVMGMLVAGLLLIGIYGGRSGIRQDRSMFRMIFALLALFFLDVVSTHLEGKASHITSIRWVNTLVFVFEDLMGYSYWAYIRDELNLAGRFRKIANGICLITLSVSVVLDLLNMKLGILFTVSETGKYIDEPLEFLGDLAIIAVFIVALVSILSKKETAINEKLILVSFEVFPVVAYLVGTITQKYTWIYPAYLLSVLFIYIRIFLERGKKIAKQQVILEKQSTALMISQIQPHFLYNVLTTISNLCVTDPEEAEETTVLFSQYLRTNLDSLRNQEPVPFSTELGHIKTYVELEKKRFGDILDVKYDIREQGFSVPSLGLQPIVENSIKHGIRGKNAPGTIKISTEKVADGYRVIIEDDGIGFDQNMPPKEDGRSHVGMTNVKERLRQMCNASMKVESSPGNGCRTEILIPEK